ncbi:hypothetical protein M758_2G231800 [Ceratodon purpureus]|uniref:Peroxidase n=1 Tax=Ceratodon purpureus TaxID=3225 RepID=A0A8T0J2J8_CERPU|nr:hypothetical protein KC19_2G277800 [Ceratodon purpureus]KAG0627840.1 hypothetical protein M758_2G231800 [Ceratodon purpureus]
MAKPNSVSNHVTVVVLLVTLCLSILSSAVKAQLVSDFYKTSCPNAESTITSAVNSSFNKRRASAPGVLRIHFHDCFVNGCDGSILIDSPSEKDAIPNQTLQGFEVIDAAKTAVEKICPGVVSCADILALASQLSVKLMSGGRITWKVPTGRRDGLSSTSASVSGKLNTPNDSVAQLKSVFAGVGLSTDQMVTLSGGHSIGVAHCSAFQSRLGTPPDPTLDPTYAAALQATCPGGTTGTSTNTVNLDLTTPTNLDEVYYKNLQVKKGLLTSDQNLQNDAETQPMVAANTNFATFGPKFRDAMIAMGNINVLTGTSGNIRLNCRKFN